MFVVDLITGGLTSPTHFNNVITAEIKKIIKTLTYWATREITATVRGDDFGLSGFHQQSEQLQHFLTAILWCSSFNFPQLADLHNSVGFPSFYMKYYHRIIHTSMVNIYVGNLII